ncbi:MAG: type II secretion system protein GspE, partial [Ghiorsea sp.]|nr:type II secretion system protein GspE [Ghiorsea sp.]
MRKSRLGDILLRKKAISKEQLEEAIKNMKLNGETLITALVQMNLFTEDALVKFISQTFGRPAIELLPIEINKDLTCITIDMMRKHQVIPIKRKGSNITLAIADPYDISSLDELSFISGAQVEVVIVRESELMSKLDDLSGSGQGLEDVMAEMGATDVELVDTEEAQANDEFLATASEEAPVVKLVNLILLDAIKR